MRAKSRYTLQRTMIIYFLLIGFASCMVGVEFLADFNTAYIETELNQGTDHHPHDKNTVLAYFDRMRKKALVVVAIIMVVTLIVLTMFIKNISEPLQHMIDNARTILKGDLSRTIRIQSDNELSELGNMINEMSSNLQEILLLSRGLCATGKKITDETIRQLDSGVLDGQGQAGIIENVEHLRDEFVSMDQIIDYFSFYRGDKSA